MFHESPKSHGNALFIILITVALFAALSYVVAQSFRGGTTTISDEQARVAAASILRDMDAIKNGFNYLWVEKGCSMDEISFIKAGKESGVEDFDALSPRPDESCDVFDILGGGVAYPENLLQYQNNPNAENANIFKFKFPGYNFVNSVVDLGTSANDILILFNYVSEPVCLNINKQLQYNFTEIPLDGSIIIGDTVGEEFKGKKAGCREVSDKFQVFYVVEAF